MSRRLAPQRARTTAFGLAILAACLTGPAPALASHVGEEATTDQQMVSTNDQLLGALRQFETAPPAAQQARLQQLVQLSVQRKERLLRLLERNPRLAALRLLPDSLRQRMPEAARANVEQNLRASGAVYAAVSDDFVRGVAGQKFYLQPDSGGARLELHLADPAGRERDLLGWTGRRVSVDGSRLDGHLIIKERGQVQLMAADGTTTTDTVVSSTTALVKGDQKTLVILANFSDKALSCTAADVEARVFGPTGSTVNNNYLEASRNVVSFSGNVAGPYTIPYSASGSCDYSGWATAADAAAKAAGLDPALYTRVSYVTPSNGSCGWSGLGYMPGKRTWVQSCGSTGLFSHELGHNLSFHHAATPSSEYGDYSDPMGGARVVRLNGANQAMAGWLPAGALQDVSGGGAYAVSALELGSPTTPQVLRLYKPDTNEYYYVSLRQAIGVDTALSATYLNTLSIHRAAGKLPARTTLMQNLAVGQSFTDGVNGITVTHQGLSGSVSTVGVSFSGATCARAAPAVAVGPASQSASPGGAVSYTVSVTNLNSTACGTGTFSLAQAMPAGLTGTLGAASLAIAPAATASTTMQVASATTAGDGTYTFDVSATDPAAPATGTAHGAYVVYRDTAPPAVAFTSPADGAVLSTRTSATLSASASDASGIAAVEFYAGDTLLGRDTSAPYSASWNLRKATRGAYTLRVRATDRAGNVAEQSITVTVK